MSFRLSPCSSLYLKALTNPFDSTIVAACIPDLIDIPSKKVKIMTRSSFTVGTAGVGFISVSPKGASCSDVAFANVTSATFTGAVITDSGGGFVNTVFMLQAPLTFANLGTGLNQIAPRVVGFGVRVRYTGTELNRGGRLILFRATTMDFDSSGMSVSDLLAVRTTITRPVSRSWHSVAWLPGKSTDYDFFTTLANANTTSPLVILVEGATAGNTFEVELVGHYEYIGATDNTSRSHTDLPGMSAIKDAINSEAAIEEPGPSWFQQSVSWITNNGVVEASGPMVGRIATDLLRQRVGL